MKQMIKKTAVVLSLVMVCAPVGAMAANKLIVNGTDGTTPAYVVTDTGFVGVGTSTPDAPLTLNAGGLFPANVIKVVGNEITKGAGLIAYNNRTDGTLNKAGDTLGIVYFGSNTGGVLQHATGFAGAAEADWTTTSRPSYFYFSTTAAGSTARTERFRIASTGNIGIGTTNPTSKLHVVGLPAYSNNAAAIAGGLTAGAFYRTGADPDVVCVVH